MPFDLTPKVVGLSILAIFIVLTLSWRRFRKKTKVKPPPPSILEAPQRSRFIKVIDGGGAIILALGILAILLYPFRNILSPEQASSAQNEEVKFWFGYVQAIAQINSAQCTPPISYSDCKVDVKIGKKENGEPMIERISMIYIKNLPQAP